MCKFILHCTLFECPVSTYGVIILVCVQACIFRLACRRGVVTGSSASRWSGWNRWLPISLSLNACDSVNMERQAHYCCSNHKYGVANLSSLSIEICSSIFAICGVLGCLASIHVVIAILLQGIHHCEVLTSDRGGGCVTALHIRDSGGNRGPGIVTRERFKMQISTTEIVCD